MSHSHYTKALDNRLASVEGLIGAIRRLMSEGRDCESSIKKIAKIVLKDHFNRCVKESIENGDNEAIESFDTILDKFI